MPLCQYILHFFLDGQSLCICRVSLVPKHPFVSINYRPPHLLENLQESFSYASSSPLLLVPPLYWSPLLSSVQVVSLHRVPVCYLLLS